MLCSVSQIRERATQLTSHSLPPILWNPSPKLTLPLDDIPPHLLYLSLRTRRRKPLRKKIMHCLHARKTVPLVDEICDAVLGDWDESDESGTYVSDRGTAEAAEDLA
jgi:hypothetical protein